MKKVLVLTAHPDDLELACGGTVARFVDEGVEVTNLIVCSLRLELLRSISRRHLIPLLPISTDEDVAEQVRRLLGNVGTASRV